MLGRIGFAVVIVVGMAVATPAATAQSEDPLADLPADCERCQLVFALDHVNRTVPVDLYNLSAFSDLDEDDDSDQAASPGECKDEQPPEVYQGSIAEDELGSHPGEKIHQVVEELCRGSQTVDGCIEAVAGYAVDLVEDLAQDAFILVLTVVFLVVNVLFFVISLLFGEDPCQLPFFYPFCYPG